MLLQKYEIKKDILQIQLLNLIVKMNMKISKLPLNRIKNLNYDSQLEQSHQQIEASFEQDGQQIDQMICNLKSLYFKKRQYLVQVMKQIAAQNKINTNKPDELQLPPNIQKQREKQFTNNHESQYLTKNNLSSSSARKKIIEGYKIKQQINQQINKKHDQLQDSTNKQINQIYQKKFGNFHFMNPFGSFMEEQENISQNSLQQQSAQIKRKSARSNQMEKKISNTSQKAQKNKFYQTKSNISSNTNIKLNNSPRQLSNNTPRQVYNTTVTVDEPHQYSSKKISQKSMPVKPNYMKIQDPNIGLQTSIVKSPKQLNASKNRIFQIDNSFQRQSNLTKNELKSQRQNQKKEMKQSKVLSHRESGYKNFIQKQTQQLMKQKKRAQQLAEQASKALNFQDQAQPQEQDNSQNIFKGMLNEIIQLFIISQTLKFQLKFRGFQILSRLYKDASKYYNYKIQIEEPIQSKTIMIVLKPFLAEYPKSQIDIVINSIFTTKNSITFDQFVKAFSPILNQKQVLLLNEGSNTKQLQRTIQKTKKLFITLIQMKYFTTKLKAFLKQNKEVCQKFIYQTLIPDEQQYFDSALIEEYLTPHKKSNHKKMKIQIFFTNCIDKQMRKKIFLQWISKEQHNYFYQRKNYTKIQ